MQLSLPFLGRNQLDARAGRLQPVLRAAGRTPFYQARGDRLPQQERTGPLQQLEVALAAVEPVALDTFLQNPEQFHNPGRRAVCDVDRVRILPNRWRASLGLPAEAIAGPHGELSRLATEIEAGAAVPARGARKLLVYSRIGEPLLTSTLRDRLWHAFELPVFEELRGVDGELLGTECEAHDGLHLAADAAVFELLDQELVVTSLLALRFPVLRLRTGLTGAIVSGACPCGQAVLRFLPQPFRTMRKPPAIEQYSAAAPSRPAVTL